MILGYDYPILGFFWSMLIFFLWVAWLFLLFRIFADIFRSEMGGVAKALWLIFVIFLPFLGVLVYVIAQGDSMTKREMKSAAAKQAAFDDYVRQTATSGSGASSADELAKLASLKEQGVITEAEFAAQKSKLLA